MDAPKTSLLDRSRTNLELMEKFREYLWLELGLSDNTIKAYVSDLRLFANWLNDRDAGLQFATTAHVLDYLATRVKLGRSIRTSARLLSSLKRFYLLLARDGITTQDPTALVDAPKSVRSPPMSLSEQEVELILQAPDLGSVEGLRDRAMLEVAYASGLRVSELISLTVAQVDIRSAEIFIAGKCDRVRRLPVAAPAIQFLEQYLQNARDEMLKRHEISELLFITRRGAGLTRQAFWYRVKKYAVEAGIGKPLSPHTLRHAFAAHLVNHDADLRVVQHLLGHSCISTTQIYAHICSERLKLAHQEHHPRP